MKFDGTNWLTVGSDRFSEGVANYISLAINTAGQPYIAYQDKSYLFKATVMKFEENTWMNVGDAGFTTDMASLTDLAFSPSGEPFLVFMDYATPEWKATVMRFNGVNWVTVGNAGFSAGHILSPNIAFSQTGEAYVAYQDFGNSLKATVMKYDSLFIGIHEQHYSTLTLYPNPARINITIEFKNVFGNVKNLEIFDLRSKKIFETKSNDNKIILKVENYPRGIYLVKVRTKTSIYTEKFMKD